VLCLLGGRELGFLLLSKVDSQQSVQYQQKLVVCKLPCDLKFVNGGWNSSHKDLC